MPTLRDNSLREGPAVRLPRVRRTLRRMMIAVAVLGFAAAAGVEWMGFTDRRARSLAFARDYRWYEARLRHEAGLYRACASKHPDACKASVTCPACHVRVDRWMRFPDGREVRSAEDEADALQQAAELYAKMARNSEWAASAPWRKATPLTPAERAAYRLLTSGNGPVSMKFYEVY
ncbi:MAG: hypothetical protein U0835_15405 [Isosphaeraceae bacterium]